MNDKKKEIIQLRANLLWALADPTRLELLEYLKDNERCVCEIYPAFGKAQSTMSKHLGILHNAGFLKRRIDGVRTLYSIKHPDIFQILNEADRMIIRELQEVKRRIETVEVSS